MAGYGEGFHTSGEHVEGAGHNVAEEKHDVRPPGKREGKDSERKSSKRRRSCPVYFGVKSYLHHFYDDGNSYKDPSVYEDDDHQYLLQPDHRRRRCTPLWWKIFMWIGVTLLLFGVIGILVGYLVPPRHVLITHKPSSSSSNIDYGDSDTAYIDERAQAYNTTLDMCKLIGLILFCVGGVTLAMALLFPSFLTHYCLDEDFFRDDGDLRDVTGCPGYGGGDDSGGSEGSLLKQTIIPASGKVKEVQPVKKAGQQMLTHLPQTAPTSDQSGSISGASTAH